MKVLLKILKFTYKMIFKSGNTEWGLNYGTLRTLVAAKHLKKGQEGGHRVITDPKGTQNLMTPKSFGNMVPALRVSMHLKVL